MQSIAYTSIGCRPTNQDSYYAQGSLFIVCDGVGGLPYGEVASKLACSSISDYFKSSPSALYNGNYLSKALQYTIQQFQETENRYPELKNMATTVVLIAFDSNSAIIAWLGDSRLYHIRNNQILFVTEDHSLVNDLRKQGNTDEEELKSIRNFITNSLSTKTKGDFSLHNISKKEILTGDFFFLCTDGVLENITEEKINAIFSPELSLNEIRANLINDCEGKTNDNFTFQIIHT